MEKRVILKPKSATKSIKTEQKKPEKEILPTKIETQKDSNLYVKQLCALAISNIAYLRSLLPEDCFQNRSFLDTSVTILKNASATSPDLERLSNWLVGAFDAIDKKYLEKLTFGVFVEDPEVLIEGYEFKFTYTESDTQMTLSSGDSKIITEKARQNSKKLLRALILMTQTITLPPDNAEMNVKLHYYDHTPDDYEPPFFRKAKNLEFEYAGNKKTIEMGNVKCFWHQLNLTMNVSEHMLADEDKFEEALEKKNLNSTTATVFDLTKDFSDDSDSDVQQAPKRNNHVEEIDEVEEEIAPKSIQCPCEMTDANDHMVECKMCATIQHAVCFKLQDTEKKQHICHTCSLKCAKTPENIELIEMDFAKLDDTAVKKLCLIRRCSYNFIKSTKLGKTDIEHVFGKENSTWLIKQLVNDNQIKLADKKKNLYAIIDANETLRAYFNRSLVANSQGSTNNDAQLDRPTTLPIAVQKTPTPQPQPQQTVQFSKEADKHSSEAISDSINKSKQVFKTKRTRRASEPGERDDNDKKIRTK